MQVSGMQDLLQVIQKRPAHKFPGSSNGEGSSSTNGTTPGSADTPQEQVNFANMSRNDLRSWINEQLKAGKMSHDEAWSLAFMTMSIPTDGSSTGVDMDKSVNFVDMARAGLEGAHQRHDKTTEEMLDSVLKMMTSR